jgi:hypothetical protein
MTISGEEIKINNNLSPTINEGLGWIFPEEPFIIYEPSDEDWCRYCGIGRQGRGFIMGDIYMYDRRLDLKIDWGRRSTIFDPSDKRFAKKS